MNEYVAVTDEIGSDAAGGVYQIRMEEIGRAHV